MSSEDRPRSIDQRPGQPRLLRPCVGHWGWGWGWSSLCLSDREPLDNLADVDLTWRIEDGGTVLRWQLQMSREWGAFKVQRTQRKHTERLPGGLRPRLRQQVEEIEVNHLQDQTGYSIIAPDIEFNITTSKGDKGTMASGGEQRVTLDQWQ